MARVKAQVKEQRLARQQLQSPPSGSSVVVARSPTPQVELPTVAIKTEITSAPVEMARSDGCIDLTADEETEDEEDADEPFAPMGTNERRDGGDAVPCGQDPEEDVMDLEMERQEDSCGDPVAHDVVTVASGAVGTVADDEEETDESDVDEEMPSVRPESTDSDGPNGVAGGVRAVVDTISHALSAVMPVFGRGAPASESGATDGVEESNRVRGHEDGEEEEEEDEQWPELRPRPEVPQEEKQHESADEDMASTASEEGEGSVEGSRADGAKTGNPLEDGEIFEEGATVKSPTAVKAAIAEELQARAAATSKKKQKKRGRKKNKRKADAMLANSPVDQEELDEFGRNVRHQPMAPSFPGTQPSPTQDFMPSMGMGPMSLPVPSNAQVPSQAPIPPMAHPPIHQPPLPRTHDFGNPHAPHIFADDQIVRVNRHGGFEPFAFHGNRVPRPPIAAPFVNPAPPPAPYRYVTLDYFSPEKTKPVESPNRGFKRPLPQTADPPSESVQDTSDVVFDLDSLRAAALKTKRKAPAKDTSVEPPVSEETGVSDVSLASRAANAETTAPTAQEEEDPSLDALRMELLKSMRRNRREVSSQSAASSTGSRGDIPTHKEVDTPISEESNAASQATVIAPHVVAPEPTVPESPQFRPLTAMNQLLVIRLSPDDLSTESMKDRADSYDEAAKRFDKVVDDIRAEAASSKPTPVNSVSAESSETASAAPTDHAPSKKPSNVLHEQVGAPTMQGPSAAVPMPDSSETKPTEAADLMKPIPSTYTANTTPEVLDVRVQQVVLNGEVHVETDVLADPAKLEAERKACLASIQEADAHIARLDGEIAALRLAIAAREAETTNPSSAATACGA